MSTIYCAYCGGHEWYEGPSGGLNTNILCANDDCRHWFNHTPHGIEDLKRIEPAEEEKKAKELSREEEMQQYRENCFEQGRQAYRDGKSPQTLRINPPYGGYAEATANVDRLIGYLEEMARNK